MRALSISRRTGDPIEFCSRGPRRARDQPRHQPAQDAPGDAAGCLAPSVGHPHAEEADRRALGARQRPINGAIRTAGLAPQQAESRTELPGLLGIHHLGRIGEGNEAGPAYGRRDRAGSGRSCRAGHNPRGPCERSPGAGSIAGLGPDGHAATMGSLLRRSQGHRGPMARPCGRAGTGPSGRSAGAVRLSRLSRRVVPPGGPRAA